MTFRVGDFIRFDRAWSIDLVEPVWCYVVSTHEYENSILLKGAFKLDKPMILYTKFHAKPWHFDRTLISHAVVVPFDEVPDDVMASFVRWRLLREPG